MPDTGVKLAVTGHRPKAFDNDYTLRGPVWDPVWVWLNDRLDQHRPRFVFIGMALGVDTVAAEICVSRGQPFVACVPFVGQQERWHREDQERYVRLLAAAAHVKIISDGGYKSWKMIKRNHFMVDAAHVSGGSLLAVWNGNGSGTGECVEYAERTGCPIQRLSKW